jgi:hypothetical protein
VTAGKLHLNVCFHQESTGIGIILALAAGSSSDQEFGQMKGVTHV